MSNNLTYNPKLMANAAIKLLEQEYQVAWSARDLEQCKAILNKVVKLNPRSLNAFLTMGRIHGVGYEYEEALEWFEKGVELVPKKERAFAMIGAGKMASDFFDSTIAESFFREAVEESQDPNARIELADHFKRTRRRDLAAELIDSVMASAPGNPRASLLWCELNERDVSACETRLTDLVRSQSGELKVRAAYQLAKVLDSSGDYDGAMTAFQTAKAQMMSMRNPIVEHRRKIRTSLKDLVRDFAASTKEEWTAKARDCGQAGKLVLLGGHPRSGTTLLEQVLDSHPDIISAEETENFNIYAFSPLTRAHSSIPAIADVLNSSSPEEICSARKDYFKATGKCLGFDFSGKVLVDKNPSLTPLAPALLKIFPEIRFITMIRDPRDVIMSCFKQAFFPVEAVTGNYLTLEDTVDEYVGFMSIWSEFSKCPGSDILEVKYEEMVENLESAAAGVIRFMDLEWDPVVMKYDEHARERIVRSPTAEAVTQKVHKRAVSQWKNYEKYLEPYLDRLSPVMDQLGYR